jgi:hypothetical protein
MHTNVEFDEDDLQLNVTLEDFEELNTSHPLAVSTEFDRKSKRRSQILGDVSRLYSPKPKKGIPSNASFIHMFPSTTG